jgi:hypothetical protein
MPDVPQVGEHLIRGMTCLCWSSGLRSAEEGTDLAHALRTLSLERLAFWLAHFREKGGLYELRLAEAEMEARTGKALKQGGLFGD